MILSNKKEIEGLNEKYKLTKELNKIDENLFEVIKTIENNYIEKNVFNSIETAKLFFSSNDPNGYEYEFFIKTIELMRKNKHPFFMQHTPHYYINENSNKIYKGINHLNISYKNIDNNYDAITYITNKKVIVRNFEYQKNPYIIIIRKGYDEINEIELYDSIIPITKIKNLNQETEIHPLVLNTTKTNQVDELSELIKKDFDSCFTLQTYIPPAKKKQEEILDMILKNPTYFINQIKEITKNLYKGITL